MTPMPRNASLKEKTRLFIANAREIHGDKYDYSNVRYSTSDDPVEVICPEHGPFYPVPYNFLGPKLECSPKTEP